MSSTLCDTFAATVGTFDGFHLGHQQIVRRLVEESSRRGMKSMVVTFDQHPRQVLGKTDNGFRLLTSCQERREMLLASGVDEVRELHFSPEMASLSACQFFEQFLVNRLGVKLLMLGYDNSFGSRQHNDFEQLPALAQRCGVELLHDTAYLYHDKAVSSTQIRQALGCGSVEEANAMLGNTYSLAGTVVKGRGVGRTLHFPTANIVIDDPLKALPMQGVYAVDVNLCGHSYRGMANLGTCPTYGTTQPTFEVHLIGFDGDLYGQSLRIGFVRRLRDICRFDSPEQLRSQLLIDKQQVLSL